MTPLPLLMLLMLLLLWDQLSTHSNHSGPWPLRVLRSSQLDAQRLDAELQTMLHEQFMAVFQLLPQVTAPLSAISASAARGCCCSSSSSSSPLLQCCWSNARLHSHRGACRAIAVTCRSSLASHCATRIRPAKQCCLLLQLHAFWLSCICVSALCLVCVAVGSSVQPGARAQPAAGSTGTQGLTLSCRYFSRFCRASLSPRQLQQLQ
jgi:hypothetical protein